MASESVVEQDVGLGTAYERWAIYEQLVRWFGERPPSTAAEGPLDGMAGMAGLHLLTLARLGTKVTVAAATEETAECVATVYANAGLTDRLELVRGSLPSGRFFDLVLLFNPFTIADPWQSYLHESVRHATKAAVVFVTNPQSYGALASRAMTRLEGAAAHTELFAHEASDPDTLRRELTLLGTVREETFVDCPWWPDLFVPTGHTLVSDLARRLVGRMDRGRASEHFMTKARFVHSASDFPYGKKVDADFAKRMKRHGVFEHRGSWAGRLFGHHRAFLLER